MSNNTNTTTPPPTTSKPTSTTTASSAARTHTIKVGPKEAPHEYIPHEVDANVGDLIVFEFHPRNHSVVQADWRAPCVPADGDYFFSGIKNDFNEVNGQVSGALPTWNWTVPRPEPIFFYCTAIDSCKINGMVGVINPTTQKSYQAQRRAALDSPYMLVPGESMPAEGDSGTTATHNPSETPSNAHAASSHKLGGGAIAGIVIGIVAFVAVLCALIYLFARNQAYRKFFSHSHEGASTSDARTAQWALSTSAATTGAGAGAGTGKSEVDTTTSSIGVPRNLSNSVRGASPVNDPGLFRPGPMTGSVFAPMDQNIAQTQSGDYPPHHEGGYGTPSPLGSQRQHSPQLPPGQQQPYWIWDQSIQPRHPAGRTGGPTELEAETPK